MNDTSNFDHLLEQASAAAAAYYNSGDTLMTDAEYDALIETLENIVQENPELGDDERYIALVDSVAAGESGGDVEHNVPMLSLKKTKVLDELSSIVALTGGVIVEPKIDGSAMSLHYVNGKFVRAVTRGNGSAGKDVTVNLVNVDGMLKNLNNDFTGEIRGEVYMTDAQFDSASRARVAAARIKWENSDKRSPFNEDDHKFSNSRNAASGLINRDSVADYEYSLSFAAYDVIGLEDDSYLSRIQTISEWGVRSAVSLLPENFGSIARSNDETTKRVEKISELRPDLGFPIDGAVIKADSYAKRDSLGNGSRHPHWAIAFKYDDEYGVSVIEEILISVGRTGRLALKARVRPVLIGTLISYASLHNADWLVEKDFRVGDEVLMSRRNDVIPQIEKTLNRPDDSTPWVPPATCPKCGEEWDKSTMLWRCNTPSCGAVNTVIHAASRNCFDWDGMSEAIITNLFDAGKISNIADVFSLTVDDLKDLPMGETKTGSVRVLGQKNAEKIYAEIQKSKSVPFSRVLTSLGIRTLGKTFGKSLAAAFKDMDSLLRATEDDLSKVDRMGVKKPAIIVKGLRDQVDVINALKAHGVNMTHVDDSPAATSNILADKRVCVTGSMSGTPFDSLSRDGMNELIAKHGGTVSGTVSSTTSILVAAGQGSSKYTKAKSLGVNIMTPDEFADFLGMR